MANEDDGPASELVIVGRIASPYGIKGWVRIHSYTDPASNIMEYRPWFVGGKSGWRMAELDGREVRGQHLIARFAQCPTRDDAALLRGVEIAVDADQLPPLEEGEFYWRQLTGLVVVAVDGRRYGTVERVIATGANDVLVVVGDEESIDGRERLIPFLLDRVILDVDLDKGVVTVDWDAEF